MTNAGYILTAWGITLGSCFVYAFSVVRRGRALARRVPPDRRRWMTAESDDGTPS